jgi:hypothetical protein
MSNYMSRFVKHFTLIGLVLGTGLILLAGVLAFWPATPAAAQGDGGDTPPPTEEPDDGPDNSYCTMCHSQPGRVLPLADGSTIDLYVSPAVIADSVHGTSNPLGPLGCVDCHGETTFPHSGPSPESARAYRIEASQACSTCHNELLADSAHLEAIAAGDLNAATCVDCHGAHDTPATEDQPTLVAAVCGDCHNNTYAEWNESPHAEMGSLGCAVCHLPHGQQMRVENVTQLCLNCHNVPGDIYIHSVHLEQTDYEVTCASCHMALDPTIQPVGNEIEPTDHHMFVETASCNQCHENLQSSGIWADIRDTNEELVIERDALRDQVSQLEVAISEHNTEEAASTEGYVQLIQGLIVGLGLGAIFVFLVLPRLHRNDNVETDDVEAGSNENHERE